MSIHLLYIDYVPGLVLIALHLSFHLILIIFKGRYCHSPHLRDEEISDKSVQLMVSTDLRLYNY